VSNNLDKAYGEAIPGVARNSEQFRWNLKPDNQRMTICESLHMAVLTSIEIPELACLKEQDSDSLQIRMAGP
jgi:hypothetical protein